jgi:hypothetical protein
MGIADCVTETSQASGRPAMSATTRKPTCWYLHTISGKPAYFGRQQIVYASRRQNVNILVADLKTIKADQRRTITFRKSCGFADADDPCKYGYIVFGTKTRKPR